MKYRIHRLIITYALGVVTTNYPTQGVMQRNIVLLYNLIVAYNIDGSIGCYKGYLVYLFVSKEIIGYLDDTLLTNLSAMEVVADGNTIAESIKFEHRNNLEELF